MRFAKYILPCKFGIGVLSSLFLCIGVETELCVLCKPVFPSLASLTLENFSAKYTLCSFNSCGVNLNIPSGVLEALGEILPLLSRSLHKVLAAIEQQKSTVHSNFLQLLFLLNVIMCLNLDFFSSWFLIFSRPYLILPSVREKIPHTGDTNSLDRCGQQDRYKFEEVA